MSIWGKMAGASAGFAFGGPLGAILGGIAGHVFDQWRDEKRGFSRSAGGPRFDPLEARRLAFATALIVLAAKLAKADGVVTRDEIRAFREVFHLRGADARAVAHIYNEARKSALGFEPYARQIADIFAYQPAILEQLLDGLFAIATADGVLHDAEERFLAEVSSIFGFSPGHFATIRARWRAAASGAGPGERDPYAVLGVARGADTAEIKRTYHRLVREHHPDRLVAQGLPEEFVRQANDRLAVINAAFDRIASERGIR